jgi:hypothetical protein
VSAEPSRGLSAPLLPATFADPGLVGVEERLQWQSAPLVDRAVAHGARQGWEAWRVDELARSLMQQFAIFIDGGMSFDAALAKIDVILAPIEDEIP